MKWSMRYHKRPKQSTENRNPRNPHRSTQVVSQNKTNPAPTTQLVLVFFSQKFPTQNKPHSSPDNLCPDCLNGPHTTNQLFRCSATLTGTLPTFSLWNCLVQVASFVGLPAGGADAVYQWMTATTTTTRTREDLLLTCQEVKTLPFLPEGLDNNTYVIWEGQIRSKALDGQH